MKSAVVLCSGGLDSVVCAFYVKKILKYDKMKIVFFDYGQRSLSEEKRLSKKCAKDIGSDFSEFKIKKISEMSKSLINRAGKINKIKAANLSDSSEESKKWYVPARNVLFLTYALSYSESIFLDSKVSPDIFIGLKNEGKDSYVDATLDFVKAFNKMSFVGTNSKSKVLAPFIKKDKEEIIKIGLELGVDFKNTISCYVGERGHCGECLACALRKQAFYWSGNEDPTHYLN